jgi:hypothetical protein
MRCAADDETLAETFAAHVAEPLGVEDNYVRALRSPH